MKNFLFPAALLSGLLLASCGSDKQSSQASTDGDMLPIEHAILRETGNYYYIDVKNYGQTDATLPIGVFDSGTGGLTVLDALVRFDEHHNANGSTGSDGQPDFAREKFIYLADQANMPYGNYHSANNSELLVEHIIKDVQFLLGNKYYPTQEAEAFRNDKEKIKAIVVACNTATAYGIEQIRNFVKRTGLDIPVIGVIDAGAKGVLETIDIQEDATIGVFATVGTIASSGYEKTIMTMKDALGYKGDIQVINQGGHGVAEAVDEVGDFISHTATSPRDNYRGPSLDHPDFKIDKTLLDLYNFDFDHASMLCDTSNPQDCSILQINSTENYVRYHLVSMMENLRKKENAQPLKALVLGCTHYPYLTEEIESVFSEIYNYQRDGEYVYRHLMAENIQIIDPSENVARELHTYLAEEDLMNPSGAMEDSEFYISMPNPQNSDVQLDEAGQFTYDYKYGRRAGEVQEYVRVVPFSKENIPGETLLRLENTIPDTFNLIRVFNKQSPKTEGLAESARIGI